MEQLDENLEAADLRLAAAELETLDVASDPGARDYPYGVMGVEQRSRVLGGESR